jgi:hypothetical protein
MVLAAVRGFRTGTSTLVLPVPINSYYGIPSENIVCIVCISTTCRQSTIFNFMARNARERFENGDMMI